MLHCPYCHGYEVRDQAIGVLATGPMTVHQALLFRQLSTDVIVFRQRARPVAGRARAVAARGVPVVEDEVVGLEVTDDQLTGGVCGPATSCRGRRWWLRRASWSAPTCSSSSVWS